MLQKIIGPMTLGLILIIGFSYYLLAPAPPSAKKTETLITPTGGDFKIESTHGIFDSEEERGNIIFLSFGFLSCPRICPLTLHRLAEMYNKLTVEDQERVKVLFISVDNIRDDLDKLKKRLGPLGKNFIGATAKDPQLNEILKLFGARFVRLEDKKTKEIFVDHTTPIFVLNSKGEWADTLPHDSPAEKILEAYLLVDEKRPELAYAKKERILEILGENKDCDLSVEDCSIPTFNNKKMTLKILNKPVVTEKNLKFHVSVEDDAYKPIEIDIEGINLNMGYIRPLLSESAKDQFTGEFYLPVCELSEMKWKVKLISETKDKNQVAFIYYLTTQQ